MDEFRSDRAAHALKWGEAARDFYYRFPDHALSSEARVAHFTALHSAAALGTTNLDQPVAGLERSLANSTLTSMQRFNVRWELLIRTALAKSRAAISPLSEQLEKGGRSLQADYPNRPEIAELLLVAVRESDTMKAAQLGLEILNGPGSEQTKHAAGRVLGKHIAKASPLDLELNTIDGKKINLRTLKGKVVLLHFWDSPTERPSRHLASVKEALDKYRAKGLEAIGINFDPTDKWLKDKIQRGDVTWPQVLDVSSPATGRGWLEYGIQFVPAIWLINQDGLLYDDNANKDLFKKLEKLLGKP